MAKSTEIKPRPSLLSVASSLSSGGALLMVSRLLPQSFMKTLCIVWGIITIAIAIGVFILWVARHPKK